MALGEEAGRAAGAAAVDAGQGCPSFRVPLHWRSRRYASFMAIRQPLR
ncbi:hypothetical protein [Rhabdothermincola sediminis]|nr:hypothetical protein [Rhabdothermincola sediminis]